MLELYKYQITNGDHVEAISVDRLTEGTRISVSDIIDVGSEDEDEQITSIDLNHNGVEVLIDALLQSINEESYAVLKLNGHHLKALISAVELSMDVLDGEIDPEAKPYDLLEVLKLEFELLLERDKAKASN
ncbi:hypothetical protein QL898_05430 [Psychrobacter sp. APC 3279]|uniref:hypothetical protein n=1 Tax=Psychrobacter sp. APC 3279 TaxID=3035189 RepID=UPI0025B3AE59|nr:hypothetical protein [Psychrobacter sp. APC 3279]MDN3441065.1 hypothetical protein [Psychrobacter sp. APC 3279]